MRPSTMLGVFVAMLLLQDAVVADGLIHKLPADGAWIRYDVKLTLIHGQMTTVRKAKLTVSSVGRARHAGEDARWIEFVWKQDDELNSDFMVIQKVLVAEKHLKTGSTPYDNIIRGWVKYHKRGTKDISDARRADTWGLPIYLAGPTQDSESLEKALIDSKLGPLDCGGIAGALEYTDVGLKKRATSVTRMNERAPFGVVTYKLDYQVLVDDTVGERGIYEMTPDEVGKNAQTELPGYE